MAKKKTKSTIKKLSDKQILRQYYQMYANDDTKTWVTKEGECIDFPDIKDDHLQSILNLMDQKPGWRQHQRPYLEAEVRRRKQEKLAKQTLAGRILYGTKA